MNKPVVFYTITLGIFCEAAYVIVTICIGLLLAFASQPGFCIRNG
jgi:hypothetical protein